MCQTFINQPQKALFYESEYNICTRKTSPFMEEAYGKLVLVLIKPVIQYHCAFGFISFDNDLKDSQYDLESIVSMIQASLK